MTMQVNKETTTSDSLDWIKGSVESAEDTDQAGKPEVSGDIVLQGTLSIAEADSMHEQLSHVVNAHIDVSLDTEELNRVDCAGVQLIYAFISSVKQHENKVHWLAVSEALKTASETLGLANKMGYEG